MKTNNRNSFSEPATPNTRKWSLRIFESLISSGIMCFVHFINIFAFLVIFHSNNSLSPFTQKILSLLKCLVLFVVGSSHGFVLAKVVFLDFHSFESSSWRRRNVRIQSRVVYEYNEQHNSCLFSTPTCVLGSSLKFFFGGDFFHYSHSRAVQCSTLVDSWHKLLTIHENMIVKEEEKKIESKMNHNSIENFHCDNHVLKLDSLLLHFDSFQRTPHSPYTWDR